MSRLLALTLALLLAAVGFAPALALEDAVRAQMMEEATARMEALYGENHPDERSGEHYNGQFIR